VRPRAAPSFLKTCAGAILLWRVGARQAKKAASHVRLGVVASAASAATGVTLAGTAATAASFDGRKRRGRVFRRRGRRAKCRHEADN